MEGEHLEVLSLMKVSLQNPGTSSLHIDVGQICCVPDDVIMIILQTLKKDMLQYTPQLFKTVVKESWRRSPQNNVIPLVSPAISTEYPTIQEDAHRRLNQEEQRALDLASAEERETT